MASIFSVTSCTRITGWYGGGYDEGKDLFLGVAYSVWVLDLPSGTHTGKPVFWPVDGDTDVPPEVNVWRPGDGYDAKLRGYPISMTFGSSEILGIGRDNALAVSVISSVITADDGTVVEHDVELPSSSDWGDNNSTVILWPADALQPSTTYTVDTEVSWVTTPHKKFSWSFTTTSEPVTDVLWAARSAPPPGGRVHVRALDRSITPTTPR